MKQIPLVQILSWNTYQNISALQTLADMDYCVALEYNVFFFSPPPAGLKKLTLGVLKPNFKKKKVRFKRNLNIKYLSDYSMDFGF